MDLECSKWRLQQLCVEDWIAKTLIHQTAEFEWIRCVLIPILSLCEAVWECSFDFRALEGYLRQVKVQIAINKPLFLISVIFISSHIKEKIFCMKGREMAVSP